MNDILIRLSKSKFRSSFKLNYQDKLYIKEKGLEKIELHAYQFINQRLKPKIILNDGKQTPTKNHPVFKAQHATATCCRKCLFKWHKIDMNKELTNDEVDYIVNIIMLWIRNNMD